MSDTIFQPQVLTSDLIDRVVTDDSPTIFYDKFWAFFGVDIPIAFIKPWDFLNILDMVDIKFLNIIEQFSESEWDHVAIVEINRHTKKIKNIYMLVELWEDVRAKLYVKMCRARDGFNMMALTEHRSTSRNIDDGERGQPVVVAGAGSGNEKYAKNNSGWKP